MRRKRANKRYDKRVFSSTAAKVHGKNLMGVDIVTGQNCRQ